MPHSSEKISLINRLIEEGRYAEAFSKAEEALAEYPENGSFHIGAGNALHGLGRFDEAEQAYKQAVEMMPGDVVAPSNLASLYYETKQTEKGLEYAGIAVARDPGYINAYIHQGNLLTELKNYGAALEAYEVAEKINPQEPLVIFNKAQALVMLDRYREAAACYQNLLEAEPGNTDYLAALAAVQEKAEDFAGSADTYLRLLKKQENSLTHINLAGCLYNMQISGDEEKALQFLDKWAAAFPDNTVVRHTAKALTRSPQADRAGAEYVTELFDAFADSFDEVLEGLEYQAPSLIARTVTDVLRPSKPLNVLDLGCGTGLCGLHLKNSVEIASLTGIDLSPGMLDKAASRNIYTALEQQDILSYLPQHPGCFDLIVSGDVFTYLGDLSGLFSGIASALAHEGSAVFTISENTRNPDGYSLEPSGRFVHGKKYIVSELDKNGLVFKTVQQVELRKEMGESVRGLLILCTKF